MPELREEGEMKERPITHDLLVKKGATFLRRTPERNTKYGSCSVIITETACYGSMEIPDVIGYSLGISILIECKTSRADFLSDKKKPFRQNPSIGMGVYRYYLIPDTNPPIIKKKDLPEKWGLLVLYRNRIIEIVEPEPFNFTECALAERPLMFSVLRRYQEDFRRIEA